MTHFSAQLKFPIDVSKAEKKFEIIINERLQKLRIKYQLPPDHPLTNQIKKTIQNRLFYSRQEKLDKEILMFAKKISVDGLDKFLLMVKILITHALEDFEKRAQANQQFWQCYHRMQHAAELVTDLRLVLDSRVENKLDMTIWIVMQALTEYASACHDIEQSLPGEMNNEKASNEYFVATLVKKLDIEFPQFINHGMILSFKRALHYIGDELIVNGTTFCMGLKKFTACSPLSYLVMCVERGVALTEDQKSEGIDISRYYSAAVRSLSHNAVLVGALDTSRSAFRAVVRQARILHQYDDCVTFNAIVTPLLPNLDDPEGTLLRLGQNLRMFAELDMKFYHSLNEQQRLDFQSLFMHSADKQARSMLRGANLDTIIDDQALTNTCFNLFETFINGPGFMGEVNFAKKLKLQQYVDAAEAYLERGPMFPMSESNFDVSAWDKHQQQLLKIKQYYSLLPKESEVRKYFATVVFHIATNQPGCKIANELIKRSKLIIDTAAKEVDSPFAASTEPLSPASSPTSGS